MVDARNYISSKWLTHEDIEDKAPVDVTIEKVRVGKYKPEDEDERLFVQFEEYPKPLGCGNPVLKQIIAHLGRDTDEWIGRRITLQVVLVEVGGQAKKAIRIGDHLPAKKRRRPVEVEDALPRKRRRPEDEPRRRRRSEDYDD